MQISASHEHLRTLLYDGLRLRAQPLLAGERFVIPGATLWTGARLWVKAFRELGLEPGDRIATSLPRTPAFLMVTIACWWEGITLCPLPEKMDTDDLSIAFADLNARLLISDTTTPGSLSPDAAGGPTGVESVVLGSSALKSFDIALIMSTSGTGGRVKRIALSYENVVAQLTSHTEALAINAEDRVLSVLPWHHAFGLLVDLWPSLLSGATIFVESSDGRDPHSVSAAIDEVEATRLNMVPLLCERLLSLPGGADRFASIRGVIGGAPIRPWLAGQLQRSSLRVGYGQTEASPGICLGAEGDLVSGWMGEPLACETCVVDGELLVRGANVCAGLWEHGVSRLSDKQGWLATGDLVSPSGGGFLFVGRKDDRFKLSNGRMIDAPMLNERVSRSLGAEDVAIGTLDGRTLTVVIVGRDKQHHEHSVRKALGSMARLVNQVLWLNDSPRLRTPKGELDRRAIFRDLKAEHHRGSLAA